MAERKACKCEALSRPRMGAQWCRAKDGEHTCGLLREIHNDHHVSHCGKHRWKKENNVCQDA